jgi:PTS system nitrogen regulatory IIA component
MLLTVREAAVLLSTPERQVYRWVDEGELPFVGVHDEVRFNRADLLEWATSRRIPLALEAFDVDSDPAERVPRLGPAIRRGGAHHVEAADRESALRAAVEATPLPPSVDREFLVDVLVAREHSCSTAIGGGIAIPHVRQPCVAPGSDVVVSISYLREDVRFGDGNSGPIRTLFLIVSPTIRTHLLTLAHLARALLASDFRSAVERREPTEVLAALADRLEGSRAEAGMDANGH